jgi:uncharacterized damage-inducible protein DinB
MGEGGAAMIDRIRALYAYSAWANDRILDTAARLAEQQFLTENEGAGSIRDILVHTAWAQWLWLQRWQGASPRERWNPAHLPDLASLRSRWGEVETETARYLAALDPGDLDRIISYVNSAGETWSYPLWRQMVHQVNHATQHRSEAALLLTQAGCSPGDLDFLVYFDEQMAAGL